MFKTITTILTIMIMTNCASTPARQDTKSIDARIRAEHKECVGVGHSTNPQPTAAGMAAEMMAKKDAAANCGQQQFETCDTKFEEGTTWKVVCPLSKNAQRFIQQYR